MKSIFILFCCLVFAATLFSHEAHRAPLEKSAALESVQPTQSAQPTMKQFGGKPENWSQWFGGFHFIFLHFPIALIFTSAFAEVLFLWRPRPLFDHASRFMLSGAALLAVPTAIFGFLYSYSVSYEGLLVDFMEWHMNFGIATAAFAIAAPLTLKWTGRSPLYYLCLFILFLLVNVTSMLGGGLTFGPYHLLPPL